MTYFSSIGTFDNYHDYIEALLALEESGYFDTEGTDAHASAKAKE